MIIDCNHSLITSVLTTDPVSKCHIHRTFERFQGWKFQHFPGQPTPDLVCDIRPSDKSNNRCKENFRKVGVPTQTNQTEQPWIPIHCLPLCSQEPGLSKAESHSLHGDSNSNLRDTQADVAPETRADPTFMCLNPNQQLSWALSSSHSNCASVWAVHSSWWHLRLAVSCHPSLHGQRASLHWRSVTGEGSALCLGSLTPLTGGYNRSWKGILVS